MALANNKNNGIQKNELTVVEAPLGNSMVGIHKDRLAKLNLAQGDLVALRGLNARRTICFVVSKTDCQEPEIMLNRAVRINLGLRPKDRVSVYPKKHISECDSVMFAPMQDGSGPQKYQENLKQLYLDCYFSGADRPVHLGDVFPVRRANGPELSFKVIRLDPAPYGLIGKKTKITCQSDTVVGLKNREDLIVRFSDVGGYRRQLQELRDVIEVPLLYPEYYEHLGAKATKGVLLIGPPGVGKTMIAKAVANETGANFFSVSGPELLNPFLGGTEQMIRALFSTAAEMAPSIIFFDEIDSITPKRNKGHNGTDKKIVAQMLTSIDGMKSSDQVFVIAATNLPDHIDDAMRRCGRFDREIVFGVPDCNDRREILETVTKTMLLNKDVNFDEIVENTHGFVGSDLKHLANAAARESVNEIKEEILMYDMGDAPPELINSLTITNKNFLAALNTHKPSSMREVMVELPKVKWEDVGGLEEVKDELLKSIQMPVQYPDVFKQVGVDSSRGVLLYGPPGCGKTLVAKAFATEFKANFISVKASDLLSMWFGESVRNVANIFSKASMVKPCVLFLDEFDSLAKSRTGTGSSGGSLGQEPIERVVNALLVEMDGLKSNHGVSIIAATNRPQAIDSAFLRPGRFDTSLYVGLPDARQRVNVLKACLNKAAVSKKVDLDKLAKEMHGFSGADIQGVCRKAGLRAATEAIAARIEREEREDSSDNMEVDEHVEIREEDLLEALKNTRPSVDSQDLKGYEYFRDMMKNRGSENRAFVHLISRSAATAPAD